MLQHFDSQYPLLLTHHSVLITDFSTLFFENPLFTNLKVYPNLHVHVSVDENVR